MASTNKTTHYELSQYVGSDKPTYLTDYNNDMSAIDSGIYTAQQKADSAYTLAGSADGKADTAQTTANTAVTNAGTANTNIGTMANLETTDKNSLVGAINELKSIVDSFNLTSIITYDNSANYVVPSGTTLHSASITVAKNSTGSICKIYGNVRVNTPTPISDPVVTLNVDTGLRPETDITITPCGYSLSRDGANNDLTSGMFLNNATMTIKTDGKIDFTLTTQLYGGANAFSKGEYIPFMIFVKDFGDVPSPE